MKSLGEVGNQLIRLYVYDVRDITKKDETKLVETRESAFFLRMLCFSFLRWLRHIEASSERIGSLANSRDMEPTFVDL